jgi:hypothetical protein
VLLILPLSGRALWIRAQWWIRCIPVPHAKYEHVSSGRRLRIEAMIQL